MKKSIKAIAAASAALAMAFSCVPVTYAAKDVHAVQTEAEPEAKKTGVTFEESDPVEVPYKGNICLIADDGTVYYEGSDTDARCVYYFSLDENGKMEKSYKVSGYTNDKGEYIGMMDSRLKQCGEYFYLIYYEAYGFSMRGTVIIKLDKELNEVAKYRAPKADTIDTNGEKIFYMKSDHRTIYSTDMDGKNKQVLFALGEDTPLDVLNFLAAVDDYVGFQRNAGGSAPKDCKDYCGIIDLKTGEVTFKEQRSVQQLYESNGKIIWFSSESRDIRDSYSIDVPEGEDISAYVVEHDKKNREFFKDGEFYVFDGNELSVIKTQSQRELFCMTIDNDGNVITYLPDGKGNTTFKIYRDNKLLDTYTISVKGFSKFVANNGVITFCYSGRDPQPGDWVAMDPNMSDAEYEEFWTSMPKIEYTMKSATIKYSVNQ
ncbi:MAG: hypothetical protein K2N60_11355 [Oscillospiraceae bacterium]|nr:hypothetical protein [Oscillospiraceae bacterium]